MLAENPYQAVVIAQLLDAAGRSQKAFLDRLTSDRAALVDLQTRAEQALVQATALATQQETAKTEVAKRLTAVEDMVGSIAQEVLGRTTVSWRDHEIDLAPPWARITLDEALNKYGGLNLADFGDAASLGSELERRGLNVPPSAGYGKLVDEAMSHYVEPNLVQPTFLLDYPIELSPLAKRSAVNPRLVERFEVFVGGFEFGNAYTELNDPLDQRTRFEAQARLRAAGDEEMPGVDEDYLRAMEYGMPPMGGVGIGVDRLYMYLTDSANIRDVILFPTLRPE